MAELPKGRAHHHFSRQPHFFQGLAFTHDNDPSRVHGHQHQRRRLHHGTVAFLFFPDFHHGVRQFSRDAEHLVLNPVAARFEPAQENPRQSRQKQSGQKNRQKIERHSLLQKRGRGKKHHHPFPPAHGNHAGGGMGIGGQPAEIHHRRVFPVEQFLPRRGGAIEHGHFEIPLPFLQGGDGLVYQGKNAEGDTGKSFQAFPAFPGGCGNRSGGIDGGQRQEPIPRHPPSGQGQAFRDHDFPAVPGAFDRLEARGDRPQVQASHGGVAFGGLHE